MLKKILAVVAQLVEHRLPKPRVTGSSPACRSNDCTIGPQRIYNVGESTAKNYPIDCTIQLHRTRRNFPFTYGQKKRESSQTPNLH